MIVRDAIGASLNMGDDSFRADPLLTDSIAETI